jgi:hypothetical protein
MMDRAEIEIAGRGHNWSFQQSNRIQIFSKFSSTMIVCSYDYHSQGDAGWELFIGGDLFENGMWKAGTTDPVVARNWLVDK